MRKFICLIMASMLALGAAACSTTAKPNETAAKTTAGAPAEAEAPDTAADDDTTEAATTAAAKEQGDTHTVEDYFGRKVELPVNLTRVCVQDSYNMECINVLKSVDSVVGVDAFISQDKEAWGRVFDEEDVFTVDDEINFEAIVAMDAQVFITSECYDYQTAIDQLEPFGIPVVVCDAYDTPNFFENMKLFGQMFNQEALAAEVCDYFQTNLDYINEQLKDVEKKRVYFEYRKAGRTTIPGDSFYSMVENAHADNLFVDSEAKDIDLEAIVEANPDYIVKVSEPDVSWTYEPPTEDDFIRIKDEISSRPGWDEISAVKDDNILLLSGYVQGGAAKMVGTFYMAKFLYPEALPDLHPEEAFSKWLEYQGMDYISGHTRPAYGLED